MREESDGDRKGEILRQGMDRIQTILLYISQVPVNDYLVYRLIAPGYEVYSKMGIYQRDLTSFRQTSLLENTLVPGNCMNCHSFSRNRPENMSLHIRGALGGTIMKTGDEIEMLNTKTEETQGNCVYPYWHPSGAYVVYSVNQTIQAFHAIRDHRVEVIDLASDIVVYHPESKQLLTSDLLQTDAFETFPPFLPTAGHCISALRNSRTFLMSMTRYVTTSARYPLTRRPALLGIGLIR